MSGPLWSRCSSVLDTGPSACLPPARRTTSGGGLAALTTALGLSKAKPREQPHNTRTGSLAAKSPSTHPTSTDSRPGYIDATKAFVGDNPFVTPTAFHSPTLPDPPRYSRYPPASHTSWSSKLSPAGYTTWPDRSRSTSSSSSLDPPSRRTSEHSTRSTIPPYESPYEVSLGDLDKYQFPMAHKIQEGAQSIDALDSGPQPGDDEDDDDDAGSDDGLVFYHGIMGTFHYVSANSPRHGTTSSRSPAATNLPFMAGNVPWRPRQDAGKKITQPRTHEVSSSQSAAIWDAFDTMETAPTSLKRPSMPCADESDREANHLIPPAKLYDYVKYSHESVALAPIPDPFNSCNPELAREGVNKSIMDASGTICSAFSSSPSFMRPLPMSPRRDRNISPPTTAASQPTRQAQPQEPNIAGTTESFGLAVTSPLKSIDPDPNLLSLSSVSSMAPGSTIASVSNFSSVPSVSELAPVSADFGLPLPLHQCRATGPTKDQPIISSSHTASTLDIPFEAASSTPQQGHSSKLFESPRILPLEDTIPLRDHPKLALEAGVDKEMAEGVEGKLPHSSPLALEDLPNSLNVFKNQSPLLSGVVTITGTQADSIFMEKQGQLLIPLASVPSPLNRVSSIYAGPPASSCSLTESDATPPQFAGSGFAFSNYVRTSSVELKHLGLLSILLFPRDPTHTPVQKSRHSNGLFFSRKGQTTSSAQFNDDPGGVIRSKIGENLDLHSLMSEAVAIIMVPVLCIYYPAIASSVTPSISLYLYNSKPSISLGQPDDCLSQTCVFLFLVLNSDPPKSPKPESLRAMRLTDFRPNFNRLRLPARNDTIFGESNTYFGNGGSLVVIGWTQYSRKPQKLPQSTPLGYDYESSGPASSSTQLSEPSKLVNALLDPCHSIDYCPVASLPTNNKHSREGPQEQCPTSAAARCRLGGLGSGRCRPGEIFKQWSIGGHIKPLQDNSSKKFCPVRWNRVRGQGIWRCPNTPSATRQNTETMDLPCSCRCRSAPHRATGRRHPKLKSFLVPSHFQLVYGIYPYGSLAVKSCSGSFEFGSNALGHNTFGPHFPGYGGFTANPGLTNGSDTSWPERGPGSQCLQELGLNEDLAQPLDSIEPTRNTVAFSQYHGRNDSAVQQPSYTPPPHVPLSASPMSNGFRLARNAGFVAGCEFATRVRGETIHWPQERDAEWDEGFVAGCEFAKQTSRGPLPNEPPLRSNSTGSPTQVDDYSQELTTLHSGTQFNTFRITAPPLPATAVSRESNQLLQTPMNQFALLPSQAQGLVVPVGGNQVHGRSPSPTACGDRLTGPQSGVTSTSQDTASAVDNSGLMHPNIGPARRKQRRDKCDVCGKTYLGKYRLKDHMRQHNGGVQAYPCKYLGCDKSYASQAVQRSITTRSTAVREGNLDKGEAWYNTKPATNTFDMRAYYCCYPTGSFIGT